MPVIPVYDRRVQAQGLGPRPVQAITESPLTAVGQALRETGRDLHYLARAREQHEKEQREAYIARDLADEQLHWTQELPRLQESAGSGAPDFTPTVLKAFDARVQERLAAAPDDATRAELATRYKRLQAGVAGEAMSFEAGARKAARHESADAVADAAANTVYANPRLTWEVMERTTTSLRGMGLGAETDAKVRVAEQSIAAAHYRGLAETNPAEAVRLLQSDDPLAAKLAPEMRGGLLNSAQSELRRERQHQESLAAAAEARNLAMRGIQLGDSLFDGAEDVGAALAKAGKIKDPRERDAAKAQIGQRHREAGLIAADRERRAFDTAWETLESGGRVVDLPDAVRADLSPDSIKALEGREAQKRARVDPADNPVLYHDLLNRPHAEFEKLDLRQYAHLLPANDFEDLAKRQTDLRNRTPESPASPGSLDQQIGAAIAEMGILDTKVPEEGKRAAGRYERYVRGAVAAEQARLGRSLTYDERQRTLDRATVAVTTQQPGTIWGTRDVDKPAFQLGPEDFASEAAKGGVPAHHIDQIVGALQRNKMPVTVEAIRKAWIDEGRPE